MRSAILIGWCLGWFAAEAVEKPFPLFYQDSAPFLTAMENTRATEPAGVAVSGVTVPHHLLAAEMAASALRLAAGSRPKRIILLTPDHFKRSPRPFATSRRDFLTPLGRVAADGEAAAVLLECPLVAESNLFSHEHGAQAVMPFLARLFPDARVLPVALGVRSRPEDWETLARVLAPLAGADTLLVQSTDFSHYLSAVRARDMDRDTLRAITTGAPDAIIALNQPDHLDSKAAQWLMTTLQRRVYGATSTVADNRNAIEFGGDPGEPSTTSYITQIWSAKPPPGRGLPGEAWYFGGDTHFGRFLAARMADPAEVARWDRAILSTTGGRPLIVNLEGVMMERVPSEVHPMKIPMETRVALARLRAWNVKGAVLANNHTRDFGDAAYQTMRRALVDAGITPLEDGAVADFGPFRLAAATDLLNPPDGTKDRITGNTVAAWSGTRGPWFAFFHCGREYVAAPDARTLRLCDLAERSGAELVLGCHPHRPSPGWDAGASSLRFPSMGNLCFDQNDPENSGGLIEVRFFRQGTWAARWIPLGNLYRR